MAASVPDRPEDTERTAPSFTYILSWCHFDGHSAKNHTFPLVYRSPLVEIRLMMEACSCVFKTWVLCLPCWCGNDSFTVKVTKSACFYRWQILTLKCPTTFLWKRKNQNQPPNQPDSIYRNSHFRTHFIQTHQKPIGVCFFWTVLTEFWSK